MNYVMLIQILPKGSIDSEIIKNCNESFLEKMSDEQFKTKFNKFVSVLSKEKDVVLQHRPFDRKKSSMETALKNPNLEALILYENFEYSIIKGEVQLLDYFNP